MATNLALDPDLFVTRMTDGNLAISPPSSCEFPQNRRGLADELVLDHRRRHELFAQLLNQLGI